MARPYQQTRRAAAREEASARVLEAMHGLMAERWLEDITLDEVAHAASVSVQTVLRHFGSKDALIAALPRHLAPAIREARTVTARTIDGIVAAIVASYEATGDAAIRSLAQEARHPALKPLLDHGREDHRGLLADAFAALLPADEAPRQACLDALAAATDVQVWKLLRRDLGRSERATRRAMTAMVRGVLDDRD